ncbi:hypothetical protein [Kingella oralis]|nr:hypothetical protein [Kingella oralis]
MAGADRQPEKLLGVFRLPVSLPLAMPLYAPAYIVFRFQAA